MFTIAATVDESFDLDAPKSALLEFFSDTKNYVRYMPDIISEVKDLPNGQSVWKLKIDIPSASPMLLKFDMARAQAGEGKINFEPVKVTRDRLLINIAVTGTATKSKVRFLLDLAIERDSSFDIHPLAGLMGERSISKIVQIHAAELVEEFLRQAETTAGQKKSKKR